MTARSEAATPIGLADLGGLLWRNALLCVALLVLVVPTVYDLSRTVWQTEELGHGPIVLALVLWLFWLRRDVLAALPDNRAPAWGLLFGVLGALCYAFGRSQAILLLEIGAFIPFAMAILLSAKGWAGVRACSFALFFLLFLVPLPGFVIDAITASLKQEVSALAEVALYAAGYPVARSGVLLNVGPYQLLVADACSGLNSLFSLSAVGLLYVYLTGHRSVLRNLLLIAAILPLAFFANVLRVIVLVLVTYHFGDEAGQGFVHGAAGLFLFAAALGSLFLFDRVLGLFLGKRSSAKVTA
ncbi:exosortase B [Chitiniphilus eburneus]|uniref:Exosortase B n=1 Tax=Chitiniphilus eburneus TaxID=2571148 RepID=A0A4U0PIY1_9NEIS|nr:exosortase B [Chitiniphilus eburneus]TJZ67993.1 exosortase B [Chitiniphilus eburneus]